MVPAPRTGKPRVTGGRKAMELEESSPGYRMEGPMKVKSKIKAGIVWTYGSDY